MLSSSKLPHHLVEHNPLLQLHHILLPSNFLDLKLIQVLNQTRFLEAMIHKLPCIGSTVDAIPEIIIDGETGFLIEPDDVKNLSNKIIKLLKNPELSKNMGLKGYERAKNLYNWDDFGDKIDKKLLECLNNNL